MDKAQLKEFVKTLNPEAELKEGKQYLEITVEPAQLHLLAKNLKERKETCFDFLICISGVDYTHHLGVVYHLMSTSLRHIVVLKTLTADRVNPMVDSVTDIWKTANFQEREVFDLLGIKFNNHPDLRRLFLEDSDGFPLRKDYVDDINIVTR